jgi:hypothetical protein
MKMTILSLSILVVASVAAQDAAPPATPAAPKPASLGFYVYPGQGQDATKQGQDENECYQWAKGQTGIDPTAPPTQAAAPEPQRGGAVRGAARGAAKGAAVGAIADDGRAADEGNVDAGEGAAAGAAAGAVKGRRAQKKQAKQAEAQAQQAAQSQDAQKKETFKKAWSACLEGRGYSVK